MSFKLGNEMEKLLFLIQQVFDTIINKNVSIKKF